MLPFELPEQTPEQTIPAQLALCGFTPADVDYVINSHFHFDHVGGNRHLPDARCSSTPVRSPRASCREPFERLGYSDLDLDHERARRSPSPATRRSPRACTCSRRPATRSATSRSCVTPERRRPMMFPFDVVYTSETPTSAGS